MSEVRQTEFNTPEITSAPSPKGREEELRNKLATSIHARCLRWTSDDPPCEACYADADRYIKWVRTHSPEEPEISRHVHRALALVEQSLESEERCRAVMKQTGGRAPELVQGILDGIVSLYRRCSPEDAEYIHRIVRHTPIGPKVTECIGYRPDASGQRCCCGHTMWAHTDKTLVRREPVEGESDGS